MSWDSVSFACVNLLLPLVIDDKLRIFIRLAQTIGHPYLFEGVEDRTLDPLGEHLVENCGKLFMVDKLLKKLKERGSRVLIFTQMTRILDILEDFMVMRHYEVSIVTPVSHDDSCRKEGHRLTASSIANPVFVT